MGKIVESTDPIYVAGFGRSGTNWLLNLLDLHPTTHCRNEPDVLATSLFKRLPSYERPVEAPEQFATAWDAAVQWACMRYGERDRLPRRRKSYLRAPGVEIGLWRLLEKRRVRAAVGLVDPSLRKAEWVIPRWLDAPDALARARHVLKLNDRHCWYAWVIDHRPAARVLHLVRHPGGVLQSWRKRWLARNDPAFVRAQCLSRLERIARINPAWAHRFGDIGRLSAAAAELWYWRYSTEHLIRTGEGRGNYHRVLYERLAAEPVAELRAVYAFCGLSWPSAIERELAPEHGRGRKRAGWHERVPVDPRAANAWRAQTSPEDLALIEQVLEGSPMEHFWRELD